MIANLKRFPTKFSNFRHARGELLFIDTLTGGPGPQADRDQARPSSCRFEVTVGVLSRRR
eukprot:4856703-Prymnesium_polylepis.1